MEEVLNVQIAECYWCFFKNKIRGAYEQDRTWEEIRCGKVALFWSLALKAESVASVTGAAFVPSVDPFPSAFPEISAMELWTFAQCTQLANQSWTPFRELKSICTWSKNNNPHEVPKLFGAGGEGERLYKLFKNFNPKKIDSDATSTLALQASQHQ